MQQPFAQQFIETRQGFHEFVMANEPLGAKHGVTDIDVSSLSVKPANFGSLDEVYGAYEKLAETLPSDEPDHEVVEAQITSDRTFVRALRGEEVDFNDYIHGTYGVMPELFPEETIQTLAADIDGHLQQRGMRYDPASIEAFDKALLVTDSEDIEQKFRAGLVLAKGIVSQYAPLPTKNSEPQLRSVEGVPWAAYVTTEDGELVMGLNTHPERRYTASRLATLALHEYAGHFVQASLWQNEIAAKRMNPAVGLTAMHSAENFQLETVAKVMEDFLPHALPAEDGWLAKFQYTYNRLKTMVEYNAHVMANQASSEEEVQAAINFAVGYLPFESPKRLDTAIRGGREDLTAKACLAAYGPALMLADMVTELPVKVQHSAVTDLYARPMTARGMIELLEGAQDAAAA